MTHARPESQNRVAVIIAGGSGTRFWPLSTPRRPKQFLKLVGERTMLQRTFDRLADLVPPERVIVLTGAQFVPLVQEQLPELPRKNVIGEPVGRDTAAAVALAAAVCHARFGNPTMLVLPADHIIEPVDAFVEAMRAAAEAAERERALYTLGVPPTYPATGYGYLEAGERIDEGAAADHAPTLNGRQGASAVRIERFRVRRFKEKPSLPVAREYVASGRYYWNSGIFVWTAGAIAREIEAHLPEHARLLLPLAEVWGRPEWEERLRAAFAEVPKISIDFGVMEKAERVHMVRAPFHWNDVGGWVALSRFLRRDADTNAVRGEVYGLDAHRNIVYCADEKEKVALVGVDDLVVVRAGERTLVAHKEKVEEIKKLVESITEHEASAKGRWVEDGRARRASAVLQGV